VILKADAGLLHGRLSMNGSTCFVGNVNVSGFDKIVEVQTYRVLEGSNRVGAEVGAFGTPMHGHNRPIRHQRPGEGSFVTTRSLRFSSELRNMIPIGQKYEDPDSHEFLPEEDRKLYGIHYHSNARYVTAMVSKLLDARFIPFEDRNTVAQDNHSRSNFCCESKVPQAS
jgi:hypothetical protein